MINIIKRIKINTAVSDIKIIDNNIYLIDSGLILYIYSYENFTLQSKVALIKEPQHRHIYDTSHSISDDFSVYVSENDQNSGVLFLSKKSKIIKKELLEYHDKSVTTSKFSNNSELIAIGDEDGKVFFYDKNIEKLLFSYPPRADAISSICFCEDDRLVSVASYDKTVIIYDICSNTDVLELELSDVVEDSIFLNDFSFFIGITRDHKLFHLNLKTDELSYADFIFDEWPTIVIEIDKNHLLIGTRENYIYLVDSHTLELNQKIELQNIGVKKLNSIDNKLFIGYIDGSLEIIDLTSHLDLFEKYLKKNNFHKATELMKENIFLLTSKAVKKYDEVWEQVLEMARSALIDNDQKRALHLASPFFFDKKKEQEYNFLNANKEMFARFNKLIENDQNIAAFKLADEYTYLKDSKEYIAIEKSWQKVYHTCKVLFEKNDLESSQKAIDTLKRYSTIPSKKEGIEHLITNYRFFIRAQKLVKSRNFKLYFKLTQNKPFLTKEDLYHKVNQLGHSTYLKLLDLEKDGHFDKASTTAKYLQSFTDFNQKATACLSLIQAKIELIEDIETDNKHNVYNAVEHNEELETFKDFVGYHSIFLGKKQEALQYAKHGDTHNTYEKLYPYLGISYLVNNIALIFKLAYISEMEHAKKMNMHSIHWTETIKRYATIFDIDNEISAFASEHNFTELLPKSTKSNRDIDFKNVEFVDSILVYK